MEPARGQEQRVRSCSYEASTDFNLDVWSCMTPLKAW
uniref:Uncharacterized protein n=1 Tax=Populus trichocarpa TaxID=3694 RepID=A0A3N7G5C3_POPTR